jgi:hypothetical protein
MEQSDQAGQSLLASSLVARDCVVGVFACSHEAMASAIVSHLLILLAGRLHGCGCGWNRGADAGIVPAIETVHRSDNAGHVRRSGTIEDEGCRKVFAVGGKGERLASAPTETYYRDFAIACGNLLREIGSGVQVSVDTVRI